MLSNLVLHYTEGEAMEDQKCKSTTECLGEDALMDYDGQSFGQDLRRELKDVDASTGETRMQNETTDNRHQIIQIDENNEYEMGPMGTEFK